METRYIALPKWNEYHPWPSVQALRVMRHNQDSNGFKKAFVKVGGKVLVDERAFFECVKEQNRNK